MDVKTTETVVSEWTTKLKDQMRYRLGDLDGAADQGGLVNVDEAIETADDLVDELREDLAKSLLNLNVERLAAPKTFLSGGA